MRTPTGQILITGARGWLGKRLTRVIAERTLDSCRLDLDVVRELAGSLRILLCTPGTAPGVNPQGSLMATARRNAMHLARSL